MFDTFIMSELEIVAHRGAENASGSLSSFLGRTMQISVNGVETAGIDEIPEKMGSSETLSVGLLSRVTGEVEGNAVLLFTRKDALVLVRLLGSQEKSFPVEGFGALERSMLEETANITISSFMNCMTSHLNRRCIPNAPIYLMDMAGAILAVVLMESAETADRAIVFSTKFTCHDDDLDALFVFLPSPVSLEALEEGLTNDGTK